MLSMKDTPIFLLQKYHEIYGYVPNNNHDGDFQKIKELGSGGFSKVYLGIFGAKL